jgi:transcription antitermination factor NusB
MPELDRARRSDTHDPHVSRGRALMLLFQADVRGTDPLALLGQVVDTPTDWDVLDAIDDTFQLGALPAGTLDGETPATPGGRVRTGQPLDAFTVRLVEGVAAQRSDLDARIARHAHDWRVERMPALDRTLLRLAVWELLHEPTPPAIVLDEAVGMARDLSTPDSARYVNGVLSSVVRSLDARVSDVDAIGASLDGAGAEAGGEDDGPHDRAVEDAASAASDATDPSGA